MLSFSTHHLPHSSCFTVYFPVSVLSQVASQLKTSRKKVGSCDLQPGNIVAINPPINHNLSYFHFPQLLYATQKKTRQDANKWALQKLASRFSPLLTLYRARVSNIYEKDHFKPSPTPNFILKRHTSVIYLSHVTFTVSQGAADEWTERLHDCDKS